MLGTRLQKTWFRCWVRGKKTTAFLNVLVTKLMEGYSFEHGKSGVSLVDYLEFDEDEQIEDSSGITQVYMDRDIDDSTTDEGHGNTDDDCTDEMKGYEVN